ncbi:hypothetical protein ABW21_db0204889 [Orbilia brochopaga]|nr:hypothetical protein ABW21_db0204889 [Drechslerella brochopaga]
MAALRRRLPALICFTLSAKALGYTVFLEAPDPLDSSFQSHDVIDTNACYQVSTSQPDPTITGVGVVNSRDASPWTYSGRPGHGANSGGTQNLRAIALYAGYDNYQCNGDPTIVIRFTDDAPTGDGAISQYVNLMATDPPSSGVYRFWKPVSPDNADWAAFFLPENPPGYIEMVQEDGTLDVMYLNTNGEMAVQSRETGSYDEATWMLRYQHENAEGLVQSAYQQALNDLDVFDDNQGWIRKALKTEEGALPPLSQASADMQGFDGPDRDESGSNLFAYWSNVAHNAEQQQLEPGDLDESLSVGDIRRGNGADEDYSNGMQQEDLQQGVEQESLPDVYAGELTPVDDDFQAKIEEDAADGSLWQEDWISDGINIKLEDQAVNDNGYNFPANNPLSDYEFGDLLSSFFASQPQSAGDQNRPQMVSAGTQTYLEDLPPVSADIGVQADLINNPVYLGRPVTGNQPAIQEQPQSFAIPAARRPRRVVTGQRPIPQVLERLTQDLGPNFMNDNSRYILDYLSTLEEPYPFAEATRPLAMARINRTYQRGTPMWWQMVADSEAALQEVQTREQRRRLFQPLMDTNLDEQTASNMVELGSLFNMYRQMNGQLEDAIANYDLVNQQMTNLRDQVNAVNPSGGNVNNGQAGGPQLSNMQVKMEEQ